MSDLKRLMRSFAAAIIYYNETQTEKSQSAEVLLEKPYVELVEDLKQLIKEATTNYETRIPVLNYLLHLITKFRPLIDQPTPLEDSVYKDIEDNLVEFILNMQKLMLISHRAKAEIQYNGMTVEMYGFIRGVIQSSPCVSAQAIERKILIPFELAFNTQESQVRARIKNIVDAHKKDIKETCELRAEVTKLREQVNDLKEEKRKLSESAQEHEKQFKEQLKIVQQENKELKEKLQAAESQVRTEEVSAQSGNLEEKEVDLVDSMAQSNPLRNRGRSTLPPGFYTNYQRGSAPLFFPGLLTQFSFSPNPTATTSNGVGTIKPNNT
ncbi:hypothetical protein [Legionella micdadei]|uniref:Uncharacterized protein n=1 Tax=Legionella micdadei TaxID=451 RepID=A0A098GEU5_LEGMI|nr:hypothetical protein [Legionella micdadei]ARG97895.1 hypothetical protein B6N58_09620 [Legionella micdadei]ARG99785.1 hypothetical protein B6V88_04790 [Legionella micdadei]KTD28617.1 hypothetical protein Lmic_1728 [Legionella micdadei]NSL19208.1 hypothetical protein [Legionella micdadei]CEG60490.1 protein of unknown function [Legionella micdadei]